MDIHREGETENETGYDNRVGSNMEASSMYWLCLKLSYKDGGWNNLHIKDWLVFKRKNNGEC